MDQPSTRERLASVPDNIFHRLSDELLRGLDPRYRDLRCHGLNERGESIIGQPDSYVGSSAQSCTIAMCYTTQRNSWWSKIVEDIRAAKATSPHVREIVAVVPRDVDREAPKPRKSQSNWLKHAQEAAAPATLRVIDAKEMALHLDTEHQDLRFSYLGIPYSRLSSAAIIESARIATKEIVDAIVASGRFDPHRYVTREADKELYQHWQSSFRDASRDLERVAPVRLIPLVSDSGLGKTSLVCSFCAATTAVAPVLLLQARDLSFGGEDAIVAHAIHRLQGVVSPEVRVVEERAIVHQLIGAIPLTVVVDGLDEAHDPHAVRRAISFWVRSKIGSSSVLIVTCRPEFWRVCNDHSWTEWLPLAARQRKAGAGHNEERLRRQDGALRLPGHFSETDLERAWTTAGYGLMDLYALPREARTELTHPFTFRAYLEVAAHPEELPVVLNRTTLMETWLRRRLQAETDSKERITLDLLHSALRTIASRASAQPGGTVCVDLLTDVPRFEAARPPGPVVERLLAANLLESSHDRSDHIRFTVEAVQDYFDAEALLYEIQDTPLTVADRLSALKFSEVYTKLSRLGALLTGTESERICATRLTARDPAMSAIMLHAQKGLWAQEIKSEVAIALSREIRSRHRVRAAFAIEMLGRLNSANVADLIAEAVVPPSNAHDYLKRVAAIVLHKMGHVPSAEFVYKWGPYWVSRDTDTYYDRETLALALHSPAEFKDALARYALDRLGAESGIAAHAKAVTVLAHLRHIDLADHLQQRLDTNGLLCTYENHALFALGSAKAAAVFLESARRTLQKIDSIPAHPGKDRQYQDMYYLIHLHTADLRYLLTEHFVDALRALVTSSNHSSVSLGVDLAIRSDATKLLSEVAKACAWLRIVGGPEFQRRSISPSSWMSAWRKAEDSSARARLLRFFPAYPSVEVEELLLHCLQDAALQSSAARALEYYGSRRAIPQLREAAQRALSTDEGWWGLREVILALGGLRDEGSIPLLAGIAAEERDNLSSVAARSLGDIGSTVAEGALTALLDKKGNSNDIYSAMLLCGSDNAVSLVLEHVKSSRDGHALLCDILHHVTWHRGWRRGEYLTHIRSEPLIDYLETWEPASIDEHWKLQRALEVIDGSAVRRLSRTFLQRRGTPQDVVLRPEDKYIASTHYLYDLKERGDPFAIPYLLDEMEERTEHFALSLVADSLRHFDREAVASELRERLLSSTASVKQADLIALLGRFGCEANAALVEKHMTASDDELANVSCESYLRLTDPLRVPERWRLF